MSISIQFFGAARQVTGSRHLLRVNGHSVLLDCGMVQGPRRLSIEMNTDLPPALTEADAVVLSHAHIDHSGSLPRLVKLGFRGKIHCTPATADLLGILLPDSANIQEQDAKQLRKRGRDVEPAYDAEDVERTLERLKTKGYHHAFDVCPGVRATFLDAGHILGSAQVILDVDDGERTMRIGFTGDLGRKELPILRDPDPLPECDVLITESTYGDRLHPSSEEVQNQVLELVAERKRQVNGRVLIPAFSVGRTQNILWTLGRLRAAGQMLPLPIYIDSPLSTKATAAVARHPELFDSETRAVIESGEEPFFFDGVKCVESVEESKSLNALRRGIIISASGMCEGGRVLHHLERSIGREEDFVVLVGFQAERTLGRRLLDGDETVKIYGDVHRVRCQVRYLDGLSAHADSSELLAHLTPRANDVQRVFVVHGEENAALRLAQDLRGAGFRDVAVPTVEDEFEL